MLGLGVGFYKLAGPDYVDAFTPLETSSGTLKLWLQNNVNVTAGLWQDSSGNENNATQETSANQAVVEDGGLDFEGTDGDFYTLSSDIVVSGREALSIFMVVNIESFADGGAQNTFLGTGETATFLEFQNNKRIRIKTASGTDIIEYATDTFATGTKMLVHIQRESGATGAIVLQKNGSTISAASNPSGDGNNDGAITFDRIGARNNDRFFDGILYEMLVYETTDLTAGDIKNINDFLISKHGL
tara:strand:+ start:392 stop:1123 length:732 start_codon:yes stop_codon:yes gene_type:complete